MGDDVAHVRPILFFDGDCGLCARAVQWCLRHDHKRVLRFAPLQGPTYAAVTAAEKPMDLNTLVLLDSDGLHVRSSGALRMVRHLGGIRALGATVLLWVVPRVLRDWVYRGIARRRMSWFGPASQCLLPSSEDRGRFLP
ncbi:MAG: DUF393 domain-containing protein [Pyrinomonadaceae bacterium]|nr:DUF393 domain-containing protein [Phycisphaerales bacterium]